MDAGAPRRARPDPLPRIAGAEDVLAPAVQARLIPAMQEAIAAARQARAPYGAILLDAVSGETVYRARNTRLASGDPTAHAEMNALRGAALDGIDLTRTVLVTSAEPCSMCGSAAVLVRVAGIIFGTSISTLIRCGWSLIDLPVAEVVARSFLPGLPVVGGVLAAETDPLYAAGPPV